MTDRKGKTPEAMSLEVLTKRLLEYLDLDPETFNKLYIDNLIRISMSQLVGHDGQKSLLIKADSAGRLLISVAEAGFDNYVWGQLLNVAAPTVVDLGAICSRVVVDNTDQIGSVAFSKDNLTYGTTINMTGDGFVDFPIQCRYIKFDAVSGTPDFTYVGFY